MPALLVCLGVLNAVVQHFTHGPGPGVGIAQFGILPIRRRLQHSRTQSSGGRTGDEWNQGLSREDLAPASQPGQKRGGTALGTKVPRFSFTAERESRIRIAIESRRRLTARVRELQQRGRGQSLVRLIKNLN